MKKINPIEKVVKDSKRIFNSRKLSKMQARQAKRMGVLTKKL